MPTDKIQIKTYVDDDEKAMLDKQASLKGISLAQLIRQALRLEKTEAELGSLPKANSDLDEIIIKVAKQLVDYPNLPEYIEVPAKLLLDEDCPRMGHRRRDCPCANCICKRARIAKGQSIGEPLNPGSLPQAAQAWSVPTVGPLARQYAYGEGLGQHT